MARVDRDTETPAVTTLSRFNTQLYQSVQRIMYANNHASILTNGRILPSPPTQLRRGVHRMSSISRKKGGIFVPERDSCFWEIGGYFVVEARKRGTFSGPEFVILYRKEGAPDVDDSNLQNHWSVKTFHWYFTWIIKNDYDKTQLNITCNNF